MQPSLFISYSRREIPFVDDLVFNLEKSKYETWLDYHNLIPGKAWQQQIVDAIRNSDIFLLVVSKESIASKNVELEWREAITQKKRIILIIFEAVKLSPDLKRCEWVDFRDSFKPSLQILFKQLLEEKNQALPPPEEGFRAPAIVWLSFSIAVVLSLLSLAAIWTLYLPYYLVPLPYRILKRDFSFIHVQGATLILPLFLFFNMAFFGVYLDERSSLPPLFILLGIVFLLSIPVTLLFLFLLRFSGLQRWGKPVATRPKFRNQYKVPFARGKQKVSYCIDYAMQDTMYARVIVKELGKDNHRFVENESDAEIALVLISKFKKTTNLNPEERVVYPILLQETSPIDPHLKLIQWVDFRRGIRNIRQFSALLGNPQKMLKALGIPPSSQQTVLPTVVQGIDYLLAFYSMITIGAVLSIYVLDLSKFFSPPSIARFIIVFVFLTTINSLRLDFVNREGRIVRSGVSLIATLGVTLMLVNIISNTSLLYGISSEESGVNSFSLSVLIAEVLSLINLLATGIMTLLTLIYWRDLMRWVPFEQSQGFRLRLKNYLGKFIIALLLANSILFLIPVVEGIFIALLGL